MRPYLFSSAPIISAILLLVVLGVVGVSISSSHNMYIESNTTSTTETIIPTTTNKQVVNPPRLVCRNEILIAKNLSLPSTINIKAYKASLLSDKEAISIALNVYQVLRGLDKSPSYNVTRNSSSSMRLVLGDGGEIRIERDIAVVVVDFGDPLSLHSSDSLKAIGMRDELFTFIRGELLKTLGVDNVILESTSPVSLYKATTNSYGGENISKLGNIAFSYKIRLQIDGVPIYGVLGRILLTTNGASFHLVIPDIKLEPINQTITLSFTKALENLKRGEYLVNMGTFRPCNATVVKYWTGYYLTPVYIGKIMPPAVIFGVQNSDGYWTVPVKAG